MSESNLSMVELARRNGVDDVLTLAKIERAEYIAELLHTSGCWIKRIIVAATQGLSHSLHTAFSRHAH